MPSRDFKRNAMSISVFVLPVVLVKLVAMLAGGSTPMGAQAAAPKAAPIGLPALDLAPPTWSQQQVSAASHAAFLRNMPFGKSPLYDESSFEAARAPAFAAANPATTQPSMPVLPSAREFYLQVVLNTPRGAIVIINDRLYDLGEYIDNSRWLLCGVDADKFLATLRHAETDETITIGREIRRRGGECCCGYAAKR